MKKQALLLFFFSVGMYLFAQAQVFIMDLPPGYNKVVSAEKEKGLDGSPWLTELWVPGTIALTSGKTIDGLKYRYNVYRNLLYFQYLDSEYVVGSHDSIDHLMLDGKRFVFDYADSKKKERKRMMELAVDGKAKLYINYYPFIIPANYNIALGSGNRNETVAVKESYLIKVGPVLTPVDKKGKQITVALADKKQEIGAYIKKENISARNRNDLEKLVKYYNSLGN